MVVDGFTGATMLGQAATAAPGASELINVNGTPATMWDMVVGLIPGSIGETSVIAIALGAIILLWTGVASWKTMFSVFAGGIVMGLIFNVFGSTDNMMAQLPWYEHIVLGGFCFGAVFMATDPVTSARTEKGKFIYGFLIGVMAIVIRVLNPGYPEGMMLAILLMNIFAPLIDYCIVQKNITARENRIKNQLTTKISDIMNTNSNSYTIIYASIMVVVVAFLLAFVSSSLKETQYKNVEMDTKKQILAALNVYDVKDVDAEFTKYEIKDMLVQPDGTLAPNDGAFQTSYKGEIANNRLHVFECNVDGQTKYILPVYGARTLGVLYGDTLH
mgnify:CR=1 FL=1